MARQTLPKVWISFKYEQIQDTYCLRCDVIGHNKKVCSRPVAIANWNHQKPRYLPGLGVSRPAQIIEMEVPKTQVKIDPWENEMQPINQCQMQHGAAEYGHATANGVNNEHNITNITTLSGACSVAISRGELYSTSSEAGPCKPRHSTPKCMVLATTSWGRYSQQVQQHVLADDFMQIDNKLTQSKDSTDLPFSVNQESNLQEVNNDIRFKMKSYLNIAGNQEQISTQQKQIIYDSAEQPLPIK
ncbi:hypothetical protein PIB30_061322 [Stylosanthes scabra]|uniref:Zinc knuckle CX2CX4HX4C domain-containing protein n=1 Tax=Stylosanthes scabra TaxID=79078 RepID=A0ABU6TMH1_9FABA|nr:hypothetical protein [Stylosanthes scabra]